jgi:hypothetical protein
MSLGHGGQGNIAQKDVRLKWMKERHENLTKRFSFQRT